jgi:TRAP-type C4-dicarboxylate transport system permease small subunit
MTVENNSRKSEAASEFEPDRNFFSIPLNWARWWTILPELAVLTCTTVLPIMLFLNVVSRHTDWFHAFWAEDIAKTAFVWVIFLGGAIAVKYEAHVRMTTLADRFSGRLGTWWQYVIRLSPIVVGIPLIILGVRIVEISMFRELPSLQISVGYFMAIIPFSGALMIYYALRGLFVKNSVKTEVQAL